MPNPILMAGLSLAAGGIDALLGGDETMTPEQRRMLEYVWDELRKSDTALGFSAKEKMGMQERLKTGIGEYSEKQIGSGGKSLARRGASSPGQIAAMTTEIMSGAGETYGKGLTEIDLASAKAGRQRKEQLFGMLPGLSYGQVDQGPDIGSSMADFISNLAYYQASKKKRPDYSQRSIGTIAAPSLWQGNPYG